MIAVSGRRCTYGSARTTGISEPRAIATPITGSAMTAARDATWLPTRSSLREMRLGRLRRAPGLEARASREDGADRRRRRRATSPRPQSRSRPRRRRTAARSGRRRARRASRPRLDRVRHGPEPSHPTGTFGIPRSGHVGDSAVLAARIRVGRLVRVSPGTRVRDLARGGTATLAECPIARLRRSCRTLLTTSLPGLATRPAGAEVLGGKGAVAGQARQARLPRAARLLPDDRRIPDAAGIDGRHGPRGDGRRRCRRGRRRPRARPAHAGGRAAPRRRGGATRDARSPPPGSSPGSRSGRRRWARTARRPRTRASTRPSSTSRRRRSRTPFGAAGHRSGARRRSPIDTGGTCRPRTPRWPSSSRRSSRGGVGGRVHAPSGHRPRRPARAHRRPRPRRRDGVRHGHAGHLRRGQGLGCGAAVRAWRRSSRARARRRTCSRR